MKAINLIKKNKAPGLDNLTNDLIIPGKQSLVLNIIKDVTEDTVLFKTSS